MSYATSHGSIALVIIAIAVFCYSLWMLYLLYIEYIKRDGVIKHLNEELE